MSIGAKTMLNQGARRIVEEEIESAVESRNDALSTLRELGPPDLVHLVKQSVKSGNKQVPFFTRDSGSLLANLPIRPASITM